MTSPHNSDILDHQRSAWYTTPMTHLLFKSAARDQGFLSLVSLLILVVAFLYVITSTLVVVHTLFTKPLFFQGMGYLHFSFVTVMSCAVFAVAFALGSAVLEATKVGRKLSRWCEENSVFVFLVITAFGLGAARATGSYLSTEESWALLYANGDYLALAVISVSVATPFLLDVNSWSHDFWVNRISK